VVGVLSQSPKPLDRIVGELVGELTGEASDRMASEMYVRTSIDALRTLTAARARVNTREKQPPWGYKQDNLDASADILKHANALHEALNRAPTTALFLIAMPELPDDEAAPVPSKTVQHATQSRMKKIGTMVAYLRSRCGELIANPVGEHRSAAFSQRLTAEEAWRLMRLHGKEPGGGSAGSQYGIVASLLFEAVTAEANRDLERACKAALKRAKNGRLAVSR
jgi:hypothetical protein